MKLNQIICGDNREVLKDFPDNFFDSIVADPPYELKFLGHKWDSSGIAFQKESWAEPLRVLKPGGYMAAFGATRLYHRLACAIEDAGFELRDCLMWLFGQGYPKSLDVSKALDDLEGATREVVGKNKYADRKPNGSAGRNSVGAGDKAGGADVTEPATQIAIEWAGWGTNLKPGYEPIVLARKPFEGTVAENIKRWGVGALNIDACRIGPGHGNGDGREGEQSADKNYRAAGSTDFTGRPGPRGGDEKGRWPANVILDEQTAAMVDEQSGVTKSHRQDGYERTSRDFYSGGFPDVDRPFGYDDEGGASRFFYCAKASTKERGRRNHHSTVKPLSLMQWLVRLVTPIGGVTLDHYAGSGTTLLAAQRESVNFVGVELIEEFCQIAMGRTQQQTLF